MKNRADRLLILAFCLIALCGSVPGQSAVSPNADASAAAPAPSDTAAPASTKPHDGNFIIGEDDQLSINVWKEPDFSETVPVRSDGKISLPLIGELQAAGRTPLQLEQDIATKLKTYIMQPDVTVMVVKVNSQKFNILGRVVKPGSYSLSAATTVLDAIAAAGGFQDFAKQKGVYILRPGPNGQEIRIAFNYKDVIKGKNPEENIRLRAHDTIVVP